ncbi:MAG: tripartite tricarboxylate transporter TctB family protein [Pseudomonadota bacterium]|nr:tripartite tricarboxylate transporter TctB family protein [Pseudomonadota bacterium]
MKVSDTIWGVVLLVLAGLVLWHIQSFPPMSGQRFGPAVFPGVTAAGLGICALILIVKGLAHRRATGAGHVWGKAEPWTRSARHIVALLVVVGVNVGYILLSQPIGFILTAIAYLAALFLVFGVRARWILPLSIVVTLVIHYIFYKLLKVPLPWGVLERFAW